MVARNFPIQEIPYARLLQVPDEDDFMTLEEPNTNQLHQLMTPQFGNRFYETNVIEDPCSSSVTYQTSTQCSSNSNSLMEIHVDSTVSTTNRKRKVSLNEISDFEEYVMDDSKSSKTQDDSKKQNHSEIEKRRRDKMNTYITELSSMIPMCNAMSRKLDKLTVLRMAVQHLKSIRGSLHSYTETHYKPSFLSEQELKHLILQVADGFLFVVGCDRGRILYVSKSVSKILNYSQGDLLGQSWFDILHPKDITKVKEQLSSSDLNPRERLIDAKTMLPLKTDVPQGVSRFCPGARRSFFCRMKCKVAGQIKEEADTTTGSHRRRKQSSDKHYNVIHCTGYLKSWAPTKIGLEDQENEGDDTCNLSCLVAVGRVLPHLSSNANTVTQNKPLTRSIQFISRHALDGKFVFVDQRATLVLGFLPQELLGTSMYEYYHHDDIKALYDFHNTALQTFDRVNTMVYRFRTRDDGFVRLQSEWKAFKNPWTKETEYLIAKNNLVLADVESTAGQTDGLQKNFEFYVNVNGRNSDKIINSQVEASKIGCQIAEQVLDLQKRGGDASPKGSPENTQSIFPQNIAHDTHKSHLQECSRLNGRSNLLSSICSDPSNGADDEIIEMMEDAVRESPGNGPPTDGNDEAAMAVIMSLLEADAGLGGPVDFSGLPWPLP
ncbi:hypothetical protein FQR65_LT03579 [Abscondita terminalis]|nr:hypothetical protein FQR65_LT03579 [Abscondita terminalis]